MFCPKCKSLLLPRDGVLSCSCGYSEKINKDDVVKEKISSSDEDIVVRKGISPLATHDHICKKCGFKKAIFIESQISVRETWCNCDTDRPSFVCGKCGFREFV